MYMITDFDLSNIDLKSNSKIKNISEHDVLLQVAKAT